MKVRLIERASAPERTREIAVNQENFLIGRGHDCDLRLNETTISRHHCIIRVGADEATVMDLGSSNGTYLNGQRVRSQATLHSGDELLVGACKFVVIFGDEAWADPNKTLDENSMGATLKLRNVPKP